MKRILVLLALVLPLSVGAIALADGSGSGSGSSVVVDVAGSGHVDVTAPAGPVTVHNPTSDPTAYITDLENAKKSGWPLLVLVGVFGLLEIAAWAGKNVLWLAWFGKGRVSILIAGGIAIIVAMLNKLADGGTWTAVLIGAVAPAIALFAHPSAVDVAAKQEAKADAKAASS